MRNFAILGALVLTAGLASCGSTKCPAYTKQKPATHQGTAVTASAETPAAERL